MRQQIGSFSSHIINNEYVKVAVRILPVKYFMQDPCMYLNPTELKTLLIRGLL